MDEAPIADAGQRLSAARHAANDWAQTVKPLLRKGVATYDDYVVLTTVGLYQARRFLREAPALPDIEALKAAHRLAFGQAIKTAGELRKPTDLRYHDGSLAAESSRIQIEVQRLTAEANHLLQGAQTPADKIAAIAYYHARLVGIRPFKDGNKRVALQVAQAQIEKVLERPSLAFIEAVEANRGQYQEACRMALRHDNVFGLAAIIGKSVGIEIPGSDKKLLAPARVAPRIADSVADIQSLVEELRLTGHSPTWATDVMGTLKAPSLHQAHESGEEKQNRPTLRVDGQQLLQELRVLREARHRAVSPINATEAATAVDVLISNLAGPDLSSSGILLRADAKRFVDGTYDERSLQATIGRHIEQLRQSVSRSPALPAGQSPDAETRVEVFSFPRSDGRGRPSKEEVLLRAAPTQSEITLLTELRNLREKIITSDRPADKQLLAKGRELVDGIKGSDLTALPLRTAAAEYLRGRTPEAALVTRLRQHLAVEANARRVGRPALER